MRRKTRVKKTVSKRSSKTKKFENNPENSPVKIKNVESLSRCKDWVLSQKTRTCRVRVVEPELTDNNEEIPPESAESLAHLKPTKGQSLKKCVYFACEWRNCLKLFENEENLHEDIVRHITELQPIDEKYCCEWDLCEFETDCNQEITRHLNYHAYHTILKTYGESLCNNADIPRCTNDSRNRNRIPELKSDFFCEWDGCSYSYMSISLFFNHVKKHFSVESDCVKWETNKEFTCKWGDCGKKFKPLYRLIEHVRKHTNERLVGCHHCGALFRTNTILFNHCKRQIANNTQEFQCAQCFKYFATEALLRHHVPVHVNRLKCSMCNMTCNSTYSLATHMRYRHLTVRPFACVHCKKEFVSKRDLENHISRVHEGKVFKCAEFGCDFVCKALYVLKRHDAERHGDSPAIYACHCCEKKFKKGASLSRHLIKLHGFQLPSGHSRFWYRLDEDGYYRLQTMRIESLEVTKQILSPNVSRMDTMEEIANEYNVKIESTDSDVLEGDYGSLKLQEPSKSIIITINEVDNDGNVIDTKYVNASEINVA